MPTEPNEQSLVGVERQLLAALFHCPLDDSPISDPQFSVSSLKALRSYHWSEPLHQVIFDVLASMPGVDPELIREQLPTRLTRRGLPDFDLTWLQPRALTGKEIKRLIEQLLEIEGLA